MKQLVSIYEIARMMDLNVGTVQRQLRSGKLSALPNKIVIDRAIYYDWDRIKPWFEENGWLLKEAHSTTSQQPDSEIPAWLNVSVPTFPPEGWTAHPTAPGYFYKGNEVLSEADLRASVRARTAHQSPESQPYRPADDGGWPAMAHDPQS